MSWTEEMETDVSEGSVSPTDLRYMSQSIRRSPSSKMAASSDFESGLLRVASPSRARRKRVSGEKLSMDLFTRSWFDSPKAENRNSRGQLRERVLGRGRDGSIAGVSSISSSLPMHGVEEAGSSMEAQTLNPASRLLSARLSFTSGGAVSAAASGGTHHFQQARPLLLDDCAEGHELPSKCISPCRRRSMDELEAALRSALAELREEKIRHRAVEDYWHKQSKALIGSIHDADEELIRREAVVEEREKTYEEKLEELQKMRRQMTEEKENLEIQKQDSASRRMLVAQKELQLEEREVKAKVVLVDASSQTDQEVIACLTETDVDSESSDPAVEEDEKFLAEAASAQALLGSLPGSMPVLLLRRLRGLACGCAGTAAILAVHAVWSVLQAGSGPFPQVETAHDLRPSVSFASEMSEAFSYPDTGCMESTVENTTVDLDKIRADQDLAVARWALRPNSWALRPSYPGGRWAPMPSGEEEGNGPWLGCELIGSLLAAGIIVGHGPPPF